MPVFVAGEGVGKLTRVIAVRVCESIFCYLTQIIYCSISLTLPFDPRLLNGNKRGSTGRVKEIEQYLAFEKMTRSNILILQIVGLFI